MSSSLVRKGLELFSSDLEDESSSNFGRRKGGEPLPSNRGDLMNLVDSRKRGVQKQLKRLQSNNLKHKATVKEKKLKSAFARLEKNPTEDMTKRNVQYLLRLSRGGVSSSGATEKILEYSRGRLAKDIQFTEEKPEAESSVFTEEDFNKFEEAYSGKRTKNLVKPVSRSRKQKRKR